ncbi:Tat pathway signal protein [Porphyrobacter algicida]|uniref:Tat pathway signal protein n=1 Tax=Qipengyuania algicida TaxID=1836209 RepID=A0A845AFU4_9SPHN|nr:glucoamylase family protein [Qipengyuania algicida]MXP27675.1 Tat pathway signal protein [Qipengyuania algicida]
MTVTTDRRGLVCGAAIGLSALSTGGAVWARSSDTFKPVGTGAKTLPPFFTDLERRTFNFFWERASDKGLVPDRWPSKSSCSIAAIGFGITAWIIGAERGWVTREQVRDRVLATLRFLANLPMGEGPIGFAGYRGFFYHFLDMETGLRVGHTELSTVDTALMHMGILHAASWFDRGDPREAELRKLAHELVDRAEWDWFQRDNLAIPMGWHPETGFIERNWDGYNEGKLVYVLALGSGKHPVKPGSWEAWTRPYPEFWRGEGKLRRLAFAPMFGHQYSEMWIDFRGIYDAPMRKAGFDYFENSRRATLAQHAYAIANPMGWHGYDEHIWGLTACDGPGGFHLQLDHHQANYRGYSARGPISEPDGFDDGTIAPTAMLGSVAFAPEICVPSAIVMHERHGERLYGQYGFRDSFNPSFTYMDEKQNSGTVDPKTGWVANDWLGIDQGPIIGMLANYRSESVWRAMHRSANIVRGLKRAGFIGGWLEQAR